MCLINYLSFDNFKFLKNFDLNYFLLSSLKNFFKNFYNNEYNINYLKNGLLDIFYEIFPIYIFDYCAFLNFIDLILIPCNKNFFSCIRNGDTYFITLKARFSLNFYKNILDLNSIILSKFEEIFICDVPYMSDKSTFVVSGIEKAVVSKFVRSPGLYLNKLKNFFNVKIIPYKGYDLNFLYKKDKFLLNINKSYLCFYNLINSLGCNLNEFFSFIFNYDYIYVCNEKFKIKIVFDFFINFSFPFDILDNDNNVILKKNQLITYDDLKNFKELNINFIFVDKEFLINKTLGCNLYWKNIKIADINDKINLFILNNILFYKINSFKIVNFLNKFDFISDSLKIFNFNSFNSIIFVNKFFKNLNYSVLNKDLLNFEKIYTRSFLNISPECRIKINNYFKIYCKNNFLSLFDFLNIYKLLINYKLGVLKNTDMQNLNNLILKTPGNIIYDIIYDSFYYLNYITNKKIFYKKNIFNITPSDYLNFSLLRNDLNLFFGFSEYSQFLDQTNPLSELSHKRRLNFTGVRGILKDYSGFDVRDLNSSHYSKLCPVETPEGINIGLVSSLSLFSYPDKYGYLMSPYYEVYKNKIKKLVYLNSDIEFNSFITDYNTYFSKNDFVLSKYKDGIFKVNKKFINYIDLKSYQMFSVCSVLVPFLEYNDSNRVLMASNMFKQTLPLLNPEIPFVGTGLEKFIGLNTSNIILSKSKGNIFYIDSNFLLIKKFINFKNIYYYNYDFYFFKNLKISNQNTSIYNKSYLKLNNKIKVGSVLLDNSNTVSGNFCLGKNILTAFMTWEGYNFEDSIIISDKIINDEKYTSLEMFNIDIPVYNINNISEIITRNFSFIDRFYKNLDNFGIVKIGSYIKGGDIILSKITPLNNLNLSPEKNLINTIFNKLNKNSIDSSFYLPKSFGFCTVKNVEIYFSKDYTLDDFDKKIYLNQLNNYLYKKKRIFKFFKKKIFNRIKNIFLNSNYINFINFDVKKNINNKSFYKIKYKNILKLKFLNFKLNFLYKKFLKNLIKFFNSYKFIISNIKNNRFFKSMNVNINKIFKITLIVKKKLSIGDKMCGRHGNKGVISKILPSSHMPYLINGVSLDMILNPLGVPSRMNIGQLLEIHLGLSSLLISWKLFDMLNKNVNINILRKFLYKIYFNSYKEYQIKFYNNKMIKDLASYLINGIYFKIPPFNNFKIEDINYLLNLILDKSYYNFNNNNKQFYLFDGRDGKKFDNSVTVGYIYFLKLNHLSSNKLHSRSIGPYSLITQQPLKGKSNFGGQRLGEMEVWALEAYGAAYTLNEMLTIKSDDVKGRFEIYKNIINGYTKFIGNKPEIFNVMLKNINSLSIYIRLSY